MREFIASMGANARGKNTNEWQFIHRVKKTY